MTKQRAIQLQTIVQMMDYLQTRLTEFEQFSFSQGDAKRRFVQSTISVFVFTQCIQSLNFLYLFCQYSPKVIGKKSKQPEYHRRGEIEDRDFNCLTKKNMQYFYQQVRTLDALFLFFQTLKRSKMMFVRIYSICVRAAVGLLFYILCKFVCALVIVQKEMVKEKRS